jgi:hypothetical protein
MFFGENHNRRSFIALLGAGLAAALRTNTIFPLSSMRPPIPTGLSSVGLRKHGV